MDKKVGKAGSLVKAPRRTTAVDKKFEDLADQLSLVHGVLEELCERQEAMAAWHMEFARQLISRLEELQRKFDRLGVLESFELPAPASDQVNVEGIGKKNARKILKRRTRSLEKVGEVGLTLADSADNFETKMLALNEATEFLLELSEDLAERRVLRENFLEKRRKARDPGGRKDSVKVKEEPAATLVITTGKPIYH